MEDAGFKRAFVKETVLPSWWDDEIASTPSGMEEAIWFLATRLGVQPSSLRTEGGAVEFVAASNVRYKTRNGVDVEKLYPARSVALRALRLACLTSDQRPLRPMTAQDIRNEILRNGKPWVSLDDLLDWCWTHGIPVLHLGNPGGRTKMDGMAARFGDRFAIALCVNYREPSRQLFNLAHELGHIMSGHLPEDGALVDEGFEKRDPDDRDTEEDQANEFATTLLTGERDYQCFSGDFNRAPTLAMRSREIGVRHRISPGFVSLVYCHLNPRKWRLSAETLKILEPDTNAIEEINRTAAKHLDLSCLSEEDADYLLRLIGMEDKEAEFAH